MENGFRKLSLIYLITCITVLLLDLFTKSLAERLFVKPVEVFPFLEFFLIHNRGVAFGLLSDLPDFLRVPLLVLVPIVAFFLTFFFALMEKSKFVALCMGMIGGGALGNLYDRVVLGEVRDFIHLHIGKYYWPAFNLADASITTGVVLLILKQLLAQSSLKNLFNRAL